MLNVLVLGATGMTGRHVVKQLLHKGHVVHVVVRTPSKLQPEVLDNPNLTFSEGTILDMSDADVQSLVRDKTHIVSCLGHNMDFNGIWGAPRDLCTATVHRIYGSIQNTFAESQGNNCKFILMNTVGVKNPELGEMRTLFENLLVTTLRYTIPPHADNENAAAYLQQTVPRAQLQWVIVRPDSLIDMDDVTSYNITPSPVANIVNGLPTSRINVAHFMISLMTDSAVWDTWVHQMPCIVNSSEELKK